MGVQIRISHNYSSILFLRRASYHTGKNIFLEYKVIISTGMITQILRQHLNFPNPKSGHPGISSRWCLMS